ncbi:hypothetical protein CHS0354_018533 [Potamilus streckersoni]|uniref:Acetyl-CoA acetyltransferase n=1 Tax=Potamilus streckersoni TaxID=2493646 RepID=A0AAE0TAS3_9BIVA|nr:hypothetical protein CHS0354_018533 [Potamilus streckersoni]
MGVTAENIAEQYKISREEQDEFALKSQQKASAAQKAGKFKSEIVPVLLPQRKGDPIPADTDEYIKHDASSDGMTKLRPVFKKDGTVTAANASGINDGASALLVMSRETAAKLGLKILAVIKACATAGVDPSIMGTGPIPASRLCLKKAGWTVNDLDVIESNEAFAAQAISVNRELKWDLSKVNVNGGAIALGHPIGASGARILTTLLHEMNRTGAKKGLATMCIGGGQGIATAVERRRDYIMSKRTALVTGGTGGIGTEISKFLYRQGNKVIAVYHPSENITEWKHKTESEGFDIELLAR